jgi:hypothetical protein
METGFIGDYRLVSYTRTDAAGNATYPLGRFATGRISYTAGGHMAAQLSGDARPAGSGTDEFLRTPSDQADAYKTYLAYFGTYDVREDQGVVEHHVEGSLNPGWAGRDLRRDYTFEHGGTTLVLAADAEYRGKRFRMRLVWERIS